MSGLLRLIVMVVLLVTTVGASSARALELPKCQTVKSKALCKFDWPMPPLLGYAARINAKGFELGLRKNNVSPSMAERSARAVIRSRKPGGVYDGVKEARKDKAKNAVVDCLVWGGVAVGVEAAWQELTNEDTDLDNILKGGAVGCVGSMLKGPATGLANKLKDRWKYGGPSTRGLAP